MDGKSKQSLGREGENLAREYLKNQCYEILTTNYRVGRRGEVDIIARDKEFLCFIEVKTRKSRMFGMPSEAVNRKKQERMVFLAQYYTHAHHIKECAMRFDIVEILYRPLQGHEINLIKNAF